MKLRLDPVDDDDLFIKVYKCKKCSRLFDSNFLYNRHIKEAHRKGKCLKEIRISRLPIIPIVPNFRKWFEEGKCKLPKLTVVLKPLRFKELVVTTPEPGKREIYYKGISTTGKLEDWRLEIINALLRGKAPGSQPPSDKTLSLRIPVKTSYIFSVDGIQDDTHSILHILTGQQMSTPVLDAYLTLRLTSYNTTINPGYRANYKLRPILNISFHYLSVHFLPVLDRDQDPQTFTPNLKFFPKFDLQNSIFIAPCYTCKHYYLAVFNVPEKTVQVYDPSWHYIPQELRLQQIKAILRTFAEHSPASLPIDTFWNIDFVQNCAQQIDEYSCGFYVVYFTENVLKGKPWKNREKLTKSRVSEIRENVATDLLSTTKHGKKFLEAISS